MLQTGRTIILTTYHTLYSREIYKTERKFLLLQKKDRPSPEPQSSPVENEEEHDNSNDEPVNDRPAKRRRLDTQPETVETLPGYNDAANDSDI